MVSLMTQRMLAALFIGSKRLEAASVVRAIEPLSTLRAYDGNGLAADGQGLGSHR